MAEMCLPCGFFYCESCDLTPDVDEDGCCCGRISDLTCGDDCRPKTPLDRWWARLDEWQHRHCPRPGRGFYAWYWLWRPFCNYVERRYDHEGDEA